MAVELATGYVSVVPSAEGIGAKLSALLGGPSASAGEDAGKKAGGGFASGLGTAVKVLAVPALAVGIGAGLVDLGAKFQGAFNTIRVQTGQTGAALAGLDDDFKKVLASGPDSFDEVALAVSRLRVGLGLTGKPLEDLATQVLDLSRITQTDLASNLQSVTTLFNNFGVAAGDQTTKLDELFRASQSTGISVSDLATAMATSGSVLRTAGFSFEASAALLGLLSKAGIATSTVMPALSKAIKTAAKEGKSAGTVFQETFDKIKNAPNATVAAGDAIAVFGAKAGPKLADAIRTGQLSFEDLAKAISTGGDTIASATTQTETLGVKWKTFTNGLKVAIEPVATAFLGFASSALDVLAPALAKVPQIVSGVVKDLAPAGAAISLFFAALTGGALKRSGLGDFAKPIITAGKTIRRVFNQLVQNAGALFTAIKRIDWGQVFAKAKAVLKPFAKAFTDLVVAVAAFAVKAWPVLVSTVKDALPILKDLAIAAGVTVLLAIQGLTDVVDVLKDHAGLLEPVLGALFIAFAAFKVTSGVVNGVEAVSTAFDKVVTHGQDVITKVGDIGTAIGDFFAARGGFADTLGIRFLQLSDAVKGIGDKADGSRSLVGKLFDAITTKSDGTRTAVGNLIDDISRLATSAASKILVKLGISTTVDDVATSAGTNAAGTVGGDVAVGLGAKLKDFGKSIGAGITAFYLANPVSITVGLVAVGYSIAFPDDIPLLRKGKFHFDPNLQIFGQPINELTQTVLDGIQNLWDDTWKTIHAGDMFGPISRWFDRSFGSGKINIDLGGFLKSVRDFFTKDLKLGDKIDVSKWVGDVETWIEDALGGGIRSVIDGIRGWIGDTVSSINFDWVGDIVDSLFGGGSGKQGKGSGRALGSSASIDPSVLDQAFRPVFDWITQLPSKLVALIPDPAQWLIGKGIDIVTGLVTGIVSSLPQVGAFFSGLPDLIISAVGDLVGTLIPEGVDTIGGFLSGLVAALPNVGSFFASLPGEIIGWLGNLVGTLIPEGLAAIGGFLGGLAAKLPEVASFFGSIAAKIPGWLGNVGSVLVQAGKDIVSGLIDGIRSAFGSVKSVLGNLTSLLPSWKPIATDHLLLRPAGIAIMRGLTDGLSSGFGDVENLLGNLTASIAATPFKPSAVAAPGVSAQDLRALQSVAPTARGGDTFHVTSLEPGQPLVRALESERSWRDATRGRDT